MKFLGKILPVPKASASNIYLSSGRKVSLYIVTVVITFSMWGSTHLFRFSFFKGFLRRILLLSLRRREGAGSSRQSG